MNETGQRNEAARTGQMLPGIAGICMYMLVVALAGVFGVFRGPYPAWVVLPICTLIVLGVFGLLRLRRWGWALTTAGALLLSVLYAYLARSTGQPRLYVMAGLDLLLFLYLVRTEVRERLV